MCDSITMKKSIGDHITFVLKKQLTENPIINASNLIGIRGCYLPNSDYTYVYEVCVMIDEGDNIESISIKDSVIQPVIPIIMIVLKESLKLNVIAWGRDQNRNICIGPFDINVDCSALIIDKQVVEYIQDDVVNLYGNNLNIVIKKEIWDNKQIYKSV